MVIAEIPDLNKALGMYNWVSWSDSEMGHGYELNVVMSLECFRNTQLHNILKCFQ